MESFPSKGWKVFDSLNDVKFIFKLGSGNKLLFSHSLSPFPYQSLITIHMPTISYQEYPAELTCLQYSPSMSSTEVTESHTLSCQQKTLDYSWKNRSSLRIPIGTQYYFWISIDTFALPWINVFAWKLIKYCIWRPESCIFTYDRLLIQLGANWLLELGFGNSQGVRERESLHIPKYTI